MKGNMRERVVRLLETYRDRAKQISLLRYELGHPRGISPDEMIGQMSFGHRGGGPIDKNRISNKTLYIALNYQEQIERINRENVNDVADSLVKLEQEQSRLAYYVSLLEEQQEKVIRLFYFEGHSWEEVAQSISVVLRTVYKIKSRAIDALVSLYEFAERHN